MSLRNVELLRNALVAEYEQIQTTNEIDDLYFRTNVVTPISRVALPIEKITQWPCMEILFAEEVLLSKKDSNREIWDNAIKVWIYGHTKVVEPTVSSSPVTDDVFEPFLDDVLRVTLSLVKKEINSPTNRWRIDDKDGIKVMRTPELYGKNIMSFAIPLPVILRDYPRTLRL